MCGEELLRVDAVSDTSVTFGRGVCDTVPEPHTTGDPVYFIGALTAVSEASYHTGDSPDVKLLPVTGIGELPVADATAMNIIMDGRGIRPYPPGLLTVEGRPTRRAGS
jgi:hypothetical protein